MARATSARGDLASWLITDNNGIGFRTGDEAVIEALRDIDSLDSFGGSSGVNRDLPKGSDCCDSFGGLVCVDRGLPKGSDCSDSLTLISYARVDGIVESWISGGVTRSSNDTILGLGLGLGPGSGFDGS